MCLGITRTTVPPLFFEKLKAPFLTIKSALNMPAFTEITNIAIKQQIIEVINQENYTPWEIKSIFTIQFTANLVNCIVNNGLKPYDITAILTTLRERNQYSKRFESSIADFSLFLRNNNMEKLFIKEIEYAINEGIITVAKTKSADGCYHTSMHALEMANDVRKLLTEFWTENESKSLTLEQRVLLGFSTLLASTHDIIQNKGNFLNEVQSAIEFEKITSKILDNLKKKFMNLFEINENSNKNRLESFSSRSRLFAKLREVFSNLKNIIPFIARESIVNGTYLAGTSRKNFGCIIQKLADSVEPDHPFHISHQKNKLLYLHTMRCALGFCDTSRTLLKFVLLNNDNIAILNLLDKSIKSEVASFVLQFNLSDIDVLALLQRLGQSLRMFPEINQFRKGDTRLLDNEMKFYLDKISELRSNSPSASIIELKKDEILSNADMLVSILKKYYRTIPGEQAFARSQDPQEHLDQCNSYGVLNLLEPRIVSDGWKIHEQHLGLFKNHIEALEKENTADNKQKLAKLIFELLYVAAKQSGTALYENNFPLQLQVAIAERKLTNEYTKAKNRGSIVSTPIYEAQLQEIQSLKRTSTLNRGFSVKTNRFHNKVVPIK